VVGVGVPAPRHGAEGQPGDRQPATAERSLLHGRDDTARVADRRLRRPATLAGTRCLSSGWEDRMRLALNLGYQTAWSSAADHLILAKEADRLGYSSVWVAEAYGSDAPTMLAWFAGQTSRIELGSAILQIPARTPAMTAMTAATLDTISGGRFRLGLGVSGPQ